MNQYEEQGIAALLPGIEHVLEFVKLELDRMLELVNKVDHRKGPMDQDHRSNLSVAARRTWQNMSRSQKEARIAALNRGRRHRKKEKVETKE